MSTKVILKQVKSAIGCKNNQKLTLKALGLHKLNHEVIHNSSPEILGMIKTVHHLVSVEDVK